MTSYIAGGAFVADLFNLFGRSAGKALVRGASGEARIMKATALGLDLAHAKIDFGWRGEYLATRTEEFSQLKRCRIRSSMPLY